MIIKTKYCTFFTNKWDFEWTWHERTDLESLFNAKDDAFESEKEEAINYACKQLVGAKIYRSMRRAKSAIAKLKVHVQFVVTFTDVTKASDIDFLPYEAAKTKSRREVFDELCTSVEYRWDSCNNTNLVRNEVYGLIYNYLDNTTRFELNDYDGCKQIYKFGDIVKFKNPIRGCVAGIILLPEASPNSNIFCKLYDVALLKNGKVHIVLHDYTDDIHQNDIDSLIGTDVEKAKEIIKRYSYGYSEEYLKSVLGEDYKK